MILALIFLWEKAHFLSPISLGTQLRITQVRHVNLHVVSLSLSLSRQRQILFNWRFHLSRKNVIHQQGIFVHKKFKHLISATMNQQNYFLFYVSHTISYKQNQCSNIYTSKLIDISYSAARNKQTSEWGREGERAREKKGETERI